jgi:elongation factor P
LYGTPDGDDVQHVFMDVETYDQFELGSDALGDDAQWLSEGMQVKALLYNERVCGIELPPFVEVTLDYVEPGTRGDTASGAVTTLAVSTGGHRLQVPLYIQSGDVVRVDPTTGLFKDRVGGR